MNQAWREIGERIGAARKATGMTQTDLATALDLDRTAVTKIEAGNRAINSLELAALARLLRRPISWFVTEPPASVISRRREREGVEDSADVVLEVIASDVEQLTEMGLLVPAALEPLGLTVESVETAEQAARVARKRIDCSRSPFLDLVDIAEKFGLLAFVLDLDASVEGSYVALQRGGVALVQGRLSPGARRFTLAHELGHHLLADEYSPEWVTGGKSDRESLINAFAIHLLLPREAAMSRWTELIGQNDPWSAAVHLGAEFGVSWTALCGHLQHVSIVDQPTYNDFLRRKPRLPDFMERGLRLIDEPRAPRVPRSFAASAVRAYRSHRLGRDRVLELLRGTLNESDLPEQHDVPLEGMAAEIDSL